MQNSGSDWVSVHGRSTQDIIDRPKLTLCLIQMNSKENSRDENLETACKYIDKAMSLQPRPDLLVLPEFFNTEYFAQYRDYRYISYAEPDDGPTMSRIKEKAREHSTYIIATIYEEEAPGLYFDTAMIVNPNAEVGGKYRKTHPAAVSSLEKIYFKRGSKFNVFNLLDWKVGIMICYDTFFSESARALAVKGAELIVAPFATPMFPMWYSMLSTRAFDNLCYVAPCNKVGLEGKWVFGGGSLIASPYGDIIKKASEKDDEMISATLDLKNVYEARRRYPTFRDRRPEIYGDISSFEEEARNL